MSHRKISALLFLVSITGLVAACTASGDSSPDLSETAGVTEPSGPGATLPPPGKDGPVAEAGAPDTGKPGKPGKPTNDASVDSGPPPPMPGTSCAQPDQIFARACGACGTQQAICLEGKVSEYSGCESELAGGCVPGTIVDESCGNCGTHKKTCTKYCAWNTTACTGEPVSSCSAGTIAWTNAGCGAGTFRDRTCSATCQWGNFQGCSLPDFAVKVPSSIGKTAQVIVQLSPAYVSKRVTGSCTAPAGATVSTTDKHLVAYVRVENPNAQSATVSAWNAQAPGSPIINTVLAAYTTKPSSDEELKTCLHGTGDYCNTATVPCGDSRFGALSDANALVIPPNESRVVAVTTYSPHGTPGEVTEGAIVLGVRTDALN